MVRVGLSALSLGAAAIHVAALVTHVDAHVAFGVFFGAVAAFQLSWAVAVVVWPQRALLAAGALGNLGIVAVWVVSRTVGVPVGPEAGEAEPVAFTDVVATILEVAIALACVGLLFGGARAERWNRPHVGALAGAALVVVLTFNVSLIAIARNGDHHAGTASHAHDGPHTVVGGSGEADGDQLASIRQAMSRYADIDAARADGWEQEHPDWPGTGAHFYREGDWAGTGPARPELDPVDPEFLMYSQLRTGEWELIAVAYVVDQALFPEPPNDLRGAEYHEHVWTCIVDGEELEEDEYGPVSRDECDAMDGEWDPGGVWMTHVWFIDNPDGVFAEENPDLV